MAAGTNEQSEVQSRASRAKARTFAWKLSTEPLRKILKQNQAQLLGCHSAHPLCRFKTQQPTTLLSIYILEATWAHTS